MLTQETIHQMKTAHHPVAAFSYVVPKVHRGYAGQTLYVNVDAGKIETRPVTDEMKRIFVGGKGFGLWRLWHAVGPETKWNDPENELVIASGPIGGTILYPGAGKSLVVSISPLTGIVVDSNVGGHFGPLLKFAGWDALAREIRRQQLAGGSCARAPADFGELARRNVVPGLRRAQGAARVIGAEGAAAGGG